MINLNFFYENQFFCLFFILRVGIKKKTIINAYFIVYIF